MGGSTWRSLNSVMMVTLHVAVAATAFRALARPTPLAGSLGVGLPLSILVAVFLSWPLGRAIASAFHPEPTSNLGRCQGCGNFELRPLLRAGAGIFQPVSGYRCAFCGTTHRRVEDGILVERPGAAAGLVEDSGIEFLTEAPRPEDREEIRFLDDDPA